MINNPPNYCAIPWSSIEINNLGYYRVCCISNSMETNQGVTSNPDGSFRHVFEHDIFESLNSKLHDDIRQAQLNGQFHDNCKTCWSRDAAHVDEANSPTRRVWFSNKLPETISTIPTWEDVVKDNTLYKKNLISLDVKLGNLCNLTCAHCDPLNSSQWTTPWPEYTGNKLVSSAGGAIKVKLEKKEHSNNLYLPGTDWCEDPRWHEQFVRLAPQLRHLYVCGGEPMLVPWHDKMLEHLVTNNYAKDIVIEYDTNLTALNPRIIQYLKEFRSVKFSVSIDGMNDVYEWIRYPGKWSTIIKNLDKIKEIVVPRISVCIMPYNIWQTPAMEKWVYDNGYYPIFRFVRTPHHLDIRIFSDKFKHSVLEYYDSALSENPNLVETRKAYKYIEQSLGSYSPLQVDNFLKWSEFLSANRGKNWQSMFPELATTLQL